MTPQVAAAELCGSASGIVAGIASGVASGVASGAGATTGIGVDVVEVLRGSTAGPLLVAAGAVGGAAAGAVLVMAAAWVATRRRRTRAEDRGVHVAAVVALLGTVGEVVLLLVDGARPGERWLTVALARLLLLVVFMERSGSPRTRDVLVLPLVITAVLGAPLASGASGPVTVLTAASLALVGVAIVVGMAGPAGRTRGPGRAGRAGGPTRGLPGTTATGSDPPQADHEPRAEMTTAAAPPAGDRGRRSLVVAGTSLAVVAAVLGTLSTPDPLPPHHQQRLVVDGMTFDITVAPARPGPNEAHLYAFDPAGRPAPVDEVSVMVQGAPATAHELFEVSPDHHLTYALELPDTAGWRLVFQASGEDGRPRRLHLDVEP